jgi:uncharacterized membrane protein YoaK (UPF0700 family)
MLPIAAIVCGVLIAYLIWARFRRDDAVSDAWRRDHHRRS